MPENTVIMYIITIFLSKFVNSIINLHFCSSSGAVSFILSLPSNSELVNTPRAEHLSFPLSISHNISLYMHYLLFTFSFSFSPGYTVITAFPHVSSLPSTGERINTPAAVTHTSLPFLSSALHRAAHTAHPGHPSRLLPL